MARPRYAIAQLMTVVLLVALGFAVLTHDRKKKTTVTQLSGRFALVGMIDVNRDGKDDRDDLKHMIEEAGGIIDFDLPPADVGKEIGALSPRITWYVIDNRSPLTARPVPAAPLPNRMRAVLKEVRLDGIRPLPIERMLAVLGHRMSRHASGGPRAIDVGGLPLTPVPREEPLPPGRSRPRAGLQREP
jgi:hypothetical protein